MKKTLLLIAMVSVLSAYGQTNDVEYDFPVLVSDLGNYNKADHKTFPVYRMEHTVAPIPSQRTANSGIYTKDSKAIYRTEKATYLFSAYRQHWDMMYFSNASTMYIQDVDTGEKYYPTEYLGLPMDTTFWIKGIAGQWNAFVAVYPPLPKSCRRINIIEADKMEYIPNTTGWTDPERILNVPVKELERNLMKFKKSGLIQE